MLPATQLALLREIETEPGDDLPRLAYADWLEEEGDELDRMHAELIRSQVLLGSHLDLPAEFQAALPLTLSRALQRVDELSEYAPLQRRVAGVWSTARDAALVFWKGFVDEVRFDLPSRAEPYREQFLASSSPLLTAGPLPRRFACVDSRPVSFRGKYWWLAGDALVAPFYVPRKLYDGLCSPATRMSLPDLGSGYDTVLEAREDLNRAVQEFVLGGLRGGGLRQ